MSKLSKKKKEINLLPVDKFAASSLGRILAWLLKTFRIIVMSVEMVVMIAFLSRFWLDAKNSDLNDEVKQKRALIEAQANFEEEFTNIQKKLYVFSKITSNQYSTVSEIDLITQNIPSEIFLENIIFSKETITINGFSPFEKSISQFMVNIENTDNFESVDLTGIDMGETGSNLLEFSVTLIRRETNARQLEE